MGYYFVYAISSLRKSFIYVGLTKNIEDRLHRHQNGHEKTTRPYKPFVLIFLTLVENRKQARQLEKFLKRGSGKEFLKEIGS